ncbi:diguanylate cyclase response regulator [Desulfomarina profundi]|uniref:diguanylate cyclase n=1 Tax=Desulfomarina profundi TaxID=2772557 RepID=A0A8D5JEK8_9BACT|nr:diguanylate cyclase [Desulfomarina profundi]BCL62643.1 diguanylate cyclase response regulator [Desulfomarina profundi]
MQNDLPVILAVDDTRENLNILLSLLAEYDILVALDGKKALEIIDREKIDLILLDISMPEMDGYEICRLLKATERTKDIPVIFLTAKDDEESIELAYDVGGVDFITKPFKPRELLARVKIQIDFRNMVRKLEYMASYDTMTGIYNRRKFFEQGQILFSAHPRDLYAIVIDIDNFKTVNDTYGHPVGDIVIRKIARTISTNLPKNTVLGRLGGEEFAVIMKGTSIEATRDLAEHLRKTISKLKIHHDSGCLEHITISNGVSKICPNDTLDTLLNRADEALYEAKETGRNKVCFRC